MELIGYSLRFHGTMFNNFGGYWEYREMVFNEHD
jgi:hypothetical protein